DIRMRPLAQTFLAVQGDVYNMGAPTRSLRVSEAIRERLQSRVHQRERAKHRSGLQNRPNVGARYGSPCRSAGAKTSTSNSQGTEPDMGPFDTGANERQESGGYSRQLRRKPRKGKNVRRYS